MLNVKLITSPHVKHPSVLQKDFGPDQSLMYGFAPVGLLSLISAVRRDLGWEASLFDFNRRIRDGSIVLSDDFYGHAAELICTDSPDVVGFMTECDSYHHVLQVSRVIKERLPNCKVVLGGPHASAVAKTTLERTADIDAVVIGEGEVSFPELLRSYSDGRETAVAGSMRRATGGQILDGGPPRLIDDLDDLPLPAYDKYSPDPGEEVFVEVGRGCPFKCRFCSTAPFWSRRHRTKSPLRILAELDAVKSRYGCDRVHFTHDLFTTDRKWVLSLCAALVEAGTPVRWTCSARTDLVDDALLRAMANAGCDAIYFGLESGSSRILQSIDKGIPIEDSLAALSLCRNFGIRPNAGFILGLPSEDRESAEETFSAYQRTLEMGCRPVHLFGFCPFNGSSIFSSLKDLSCTGHFLDLPLGAKLDIRNREMIASDPELFSSYFRPTDTALAAIEEGFVDGVDEFSPLVESAALPTLALADASGGMFEVYRRWIRWIGPHNAERGAASWRRYYGSPSQFCQFLSEALGSESSHAMAALARVIGLNHQYSAIGTAPTSMANHRSAVGRVKLEPVDLGTIVSSANVLSALRLDWDIRAALAWQTGQPRPDILREDTFLVWQRDGQSVRLLEVDEALFRLIEDVSERPRTVAELIASWAATGPSPIWDGDFGAVLRIVTTASEAGLVEAPRGRMD